MKTFKKQDKIDVDRCYNALEDFIVLFATQRAYNKEQADHEGKNRPAENLEITINLDSETQTLPTTHKKTN